MKKIIKFIKSNILGFLVGLSLCLNGVIIAENMLSSENVSYSGSKTEQTTVKGTLDQLFDAVDINERLGNTDISSIGNGTVTNAISTLNTNLDEINSELDGKLTHSGVFAGQAVPYGSNIGYDTNENVWFIDMCFPDGTKARLSWDRTSIEFSNYDGSNWYVNWKK